VNHERKWFILSSVLVVCLILSVGFNVYQYLDAPESSTPSSYVFYFYNDYIRNGTAVRMEVTFDWQVENLSMTVTVNDDEYNALDYDSDYLGIVFDQNNNGRIDFGLADQPAVFYANNRSRSESMGVYLLESGGLTWPFIESVPCRTCTFNAETGYTFKKSFPRQAINVEPPTVVHICFDDIERSIEAAIASQEPLVWVQFKVT